MQVLDEVRQELTEAAITDVPEVLGRIKHAFDVFDTQSLLLQTSFDNLKRDLADANRELNAKNETLSGKLEEVRQLSSRLECILESLADGVLVVDSACCIDRCNPIAEKLLGQPRPMIEGRPYTEVMNGLGNHDAIQAALTTGRVTLDEQRRDRDSQGGCRYVMASSAPIRSRGRIIGAVEVLRDVTELRTLEERVQHQRRMAALGEMAASVAHEIRNPLGTIEGFARLLKSDLDREEATEHSRLASKIVAGAQNLNYVITNLLTYARPMSLQCERFSVRSLHESVRDVVLESARTSGVGLTVDDPGGEAVALGDVRQIRQVLINLGRNAVESCEAGGEVSLVYGGGAGAVWRVMDTGCGIAAEDLSRLFDPFFTTKQGGTGLGLSLCHKIVSAHGGEIEVKNRETGGTEFKVIIPQHGGEA
jgi:PAS domain S-box-containing protein